MTLLSSRERFRRPGPLPQFEDKDVSPTVSANRAGCGTRLRAQLTHPVGGEDEESTILRNGANAPRGAEPLGVSGGEVVSESPSLAAAVRRDCNDFVVPGSGKGRGGTPGDCEEWQSISPITNRVKIDSRQSLLTI
jgi:hypothetical protein